MPDPLNIRILCSKCGSLLKGAPPCPTVLIEETKAEGRVVLCESVEFEPYLPLKHVPEEIIEQKRAELLEFNAKGGPRKLTEEEKRRLQAQHQPLHDELALREEELARLDDDGGAPATGEDIPDELREELGEGFG